jgi:DNA polymerase-3 subunit epsilon
VNGPIASLVVTDVETSGLSHTTDHVIEVAIVVWDVATASVRESYASLLHADTNDAESINGISVAALAKAPPSSTVWRRVYAILSSIDGPAAFVAHRAEFDRGFYPPELAGKFPWLCSKTDFAWPRCPLGSSCVDMALRHGVPVVSAHRAMTDAMLIVRTLERVAELGHDLTAMIAHAMRPKASYIVADKGFDEGRNKLAAAAGFMFDRPTKEWRGRLAREDVAKLGFEVREVSP